MRQYLRGVKNSSEPAARRFRWTRARGFDGYDLRGEKSECLMSRYARESREHIVFRNTTRGCVIKALLVPLEGSSIFSLWKECLDTRSNGLFTRVTDARRFSLDTVELTVHTVDLISCVIVKVFRKIIPCHDYIRYLNREIILGSNLLNRTNWSQNILIDNAWEAHCFMKNI